ncbi:hypothetical protein [Serratia sp. M24T3]|nr:hypothetical protein [Serratia sp. M24T3]
MKRHFIFPAAAALAAHYPPWSLTLCKLPKQQRFLPRYFPRVFTSAA